MRTLALVGVGVFAAGGEHDDGAAFAVKAVDVGLAGDGLIADILGSDQMRLGLL